MLPKTCTWPCQKNLVAALQVVIAFRGTASLANVKADMQARAPAPCSFHAPAHPPAPCPPYQLSGCHRRSGGLDGRQEWGRGCSARELDAASGCVRSPALHVLSLPAGLSSCLPLLPLAPSALRWCIAASTAPGQSTASATASWAGWEHTCRRTICSLAAGSGGQCKWWSLGEALLVLAASLHASQAPPAPGLPVRPPPLPGSPVWQALVGWRPGHALRVRPCSAVLRWALRLRRHPPVHARPATHSRLCLSPSLDAQTVRCASSATPLAPRAWETTPL